MNKEIDLLKKNSIAFGNLGRGGTDDEMVTLLASSSGCKSRLSKVEQTAQQRVFAIHRANEM